MAPWVALLAACRLRGWISSRASTAAAAPAMAIRPLWDWAHDSSLPRLRPAAGGGALSLSIVRLPVGLQQLLLPAPLGAGLAAPPRAPLPPRPPLGDRRHALLAPPTATPPATVQSPRRSSRWALSTSASTTAITITTSACQPNSHCSIRYS